jgi:hypothetical protein
MSNEKKRKLRKLVIFAIAMGLCLTAIQIGAMSTTHSSEEFVRKISWNNVPTPEKLVMKESGIPLTSKHMFLPTDVPVVSTEDSEIHPTLTMYGDGLLFGGYTRSLSLFETNIDFIYSGDGGSTWEYANGLNPELGLLDYLAVDYMGTGNAVVVTFQPDPSEADGSGQWRIIMTDPLDTETWDGAMWDWTSHGYSDLKNPDIAGYDFNGEGPSWYYGWMIGTISNSGSGYEDGPTFYFANGEEDGSGWLWSWGDPESTSTHSSVDIDRSNGMMYSAWEYYNETTGARDIQLANGLLEDYLAADYGDWGPYPTWQFLGGSESNKNPDVAASNGYVYVACQADVTIPGKEDIICFYSHDGGSTWGVGNVAIDSVQNEMYPSIVAYGEGASITYVADGDLYVSHTDDGGVTWDTPEKVNDGTGTASMEYGTAEITTSGHTLWTDTRNGNDDIYYENVGMPSSPMIAIQSVSGGFGVSAVVANVGTAEATDVQWSIDLDGSVFIGAHKEGTISSLTAGGSETVKAGFVFGLGKATITVTAGGATKTAEGTVLGPFVIGL